MSKHLHQDSDMLNIANSIRSKTGLNNSLYSSTMSDNIDSIVRGLGYSWGTHIDEHGRWNKPDEWDDIESIDISDKHDCYILCGTKLSEYPFVRLRVYGGGTITWSYGHVSDGVYTIHNNSSSTTISSGGYISLYLGNIEDDYIVLKISATSYLTSVTTQSWVADENIPIALPLANNCVLMRYCRMYRGTSLLFQSYFLESDRVIDFAKYYQDTTTAITVASAYSGCLVLQRIRHEGMDLSKNKITSFASMFASCYMLSDVSDNNTIDMTGWVTSNCTTVASMFNACFSLRAKLIVKNWDMSNITTLASVFSNCRCVEYIIGTETWNTAPKCIRSDYIFNYCCSLRGKIDISGLSLGNGTANYVTPTYMFVYCMSLSEIDISGFNFSKVTSMTNMFQYCSAKVVKMDNIIPPTSLCKSYGSLFYYSGCKEITLDGWDFSNATSGTLNQMFYYGMGIKKISMPNCISNTVTWADSTSISACLIRYAYNLEYADFSWFDISKCSGTGVHLYGFRDCYKLRDFYPPINITKNFNLTGDNLLTRDSLIRVMNNLIDLTGKTSQTLTIGTYNLAKLSDEDKAIATDKNWILA